MLANTVRFVEVLLDFVLAVFKKTVLYGLLTVLVLLSILVTFVYVITAVVT